MCCRAVPLSEVRIIGMLDAEGNFLLVVDPDTLPPDLLEIVHAIRKPDNKPQMALASVSE